MRGMLLWGRVGDDDDDDDDDDEEDEDGGRGGGEDGTRSRGEAPLKRPLKRVDLAHRKSLCN